MRFNRCTSNIPNITLRRVTLAFWNISNLVNYTGKRKLSSQTCLGQEYCRIQ